MNDYEIMMASFRESLENQMKKQAGVQELNQVQQETLEKIASSVEDQFKLNGLDKVADYKFVPKEALQKGFMENAGKMGATALAALAVLGAYKATMGATSSILHNKFQSNLAKLIATNPILRQADASKVRSFGETIFKFGPHVASDINLLGPLLVHVVHGEAVDTQTIKSVVELEQRYSENQSFLPKNFI